jgi:thioredoxin reductase (NADPH)
MSLPLGVEPARVRRDGQLLDQGDDALVDLSSTELDDDQLAELAAFGQVRIVDAGDVLYRAGTPHPSFYAVLEGRVDVVRVRDEGEVVIASHGARRFLGELNLLTGQYPFLTARVAEPGSVLEVQPDDFRRLMSTNPTLADVIFRALAARRELLRENEAAGAIQIIGSRFSPEALALRSFATHAHLVHTWIDLEDVDDPGVLLAGMGLRLADIPVAVTPTGVLRRPSPAEFAEILGLTFHSVPGFVFDLVVVGTGPAGLAASVYGASEGLDTVSLDGTGIGGQAGASSRIENYAGFPNGISGEELVTRAAVQAQRLGAQLNSPCAVVGLRPEPGFLVLTLTDGSEIPTRATIVASGARYRRLGVDDLERFEGAGVYYAATDLEVRTCGGQDVVVVGGGNSAGQAAIYLSQHGSRVTIAIRGDDLARSMSSYLIERIDADPHIEVTTHTEIRHLDGDGRLETVTLEQTQSNDRRTIPCTGLFCFIGAEPATGWLPDAIALDDDGFVLTDRSLRPTDLLHFAARDPLPFETSLPGVFAVGDVRHGSLKRVAAAVGEGSSAVRSVFEHLSSIGGS